MVGRKIGVPELLAAVIADQRIGARAFLGRIDVDFRHFLVFFVGLGVSDELVERLVLVLLEPFERLVDCSTGMRWLARAAKTVVGATYVLRPS